LASDGMMTDRLGRAFKAAKAIALDVPDKLLALADEVIE
jgi:hypothetical protein